MRHDDGGRVSVVEDGETRSIDEKPSLVCRLSALKPYIPIIRGIGFWPNYLYMFSPSQLGFLCEQVTSTAGVPGSILEVGCAYGATTVFLNRHIDELGINVDYYAIDTFHGFNAHDIDVEDALGRHYPYHTYFRGNSKAWFSRTMRRNSISRVAPLRADATTFDYTKIAPFRFVLIDVDLYRPVLTVLKAIYDLVSPGGTIIIDDCQQRGKWGGSYEAFIEFTRAKGLEPVVKHGKLGLITKSGVGAK
jgi:predicted O-methyltransferase YrrM